jgi:deoxyribonuclease (pyrimidine dimer)
MTRINLVDPSELMDQHLIAEYREMRLLCSNLQRTINSSQGFVEKKVPKEFTLNAGHCYFFYNKGKYLNERYDQLANEMRNRGFEPQHPFPIEKWPAHLYKDWTPSEKDKNIVRARIKQRISEKPDWYRYRGKHI